MCGLPFATDGVSEKTKILDNVELAPLKIK